MTDTDRWGHPYVPENTRRWPQGTARYCRHCHVCRQRAIRAGITLARYYELNPALLEYNGFPVAGAKTGRTSGLG